MDRTGVAGPTSPRAIGPARAPEVLLPSRAAALRTLEQGLATAAGPLLLTGEPGVGKSWLVRRGREALPAWNWLTVDATPSLTVPAFYLLLLRGLGVLPQGPVDPGAARADVEDALLAATQSGRKWVLVVDEAHNACDDLLEEVRVLGNRLGEDGGFAGVVIVGQTVLLRRLAYRPLSSLGARVAARCHLRPHVDEAPEPEPTPEVARPASLDAPSPRAVAAAPPVQTPARTAWAAPVHASEPVRDVAADPLPAETPDEPMPEAPVLELPPVLPARPPVQVGDGVVEVGWNALSEPLEDDEEVSAEDLPTPPSGATGDEYIQDHYAALQAWNEWAQVQGRTPAERPGVEVEDEDLALESPLLAQRMREDSPAGDPGPGAASVWVDAQQGFAPYSQLFSRMRTQRESP